MLEVIRGWLKRYFSDQEAVVLLFLLIAAFAVVIFMGNMLAPVFAALVVSFLLQGVVNSVCRLGLHRMVAMNLVYVLFLALLLAAIFLLIPLVWQQSTGLLNEFPTMVRQMQMLLRELPDHYPEFVSEVQITTLVGSINSNVAGFGQWVLSFSLSKLPGVVAIAIYLVLVPILVYFFLKDKEVLLSWVTSRLPSRRRLIVQVAHEMNEQISNYIYGKSVEILIVGGVSFIVFAWLELNYSVLLSVLVGLSVVVPYLGAMLVTVPIAIIGFFQWGGGQEFMVLMLAHAIIQALDGNVLVPLLFSEAVNLHPVAIIVAVLVFGGLWGVWGVFFAIPLATLLKAVMNAWPRVVDLGEVSAD